MWRHRDAEGRGPCKDGSRDWSYDCSYDAKSQETVEATGSWERQGSLLPQRLQRKKDPQNLDFGIVASRTVKQHISIALINVLVSNSCHIRYGDLDGLKQQKYILSCF